LLSRENADLALVILRSQAYLEGEQATEQRALKQGLREEGRRLILKQLTRKVGEVTPDVQLEIEWLSLENLEALGEDLLDFSGFADLTNWLQAHQGM
jgi:hypothetical protein